MKGLDGKTVLITRPEGTELAEVLSSLGANVCLCPVLKIADPSEWDRVDLAIENLDDFTWIAFVSVNGVERFLSRMRYLGAIEKLQKMMIAAIGEQTARRLNRHGLSVQLIPGRSDSHGLVQAFLEHALTGSILLVRGDRGSAVIATALRNARISFQEVVAYRSIDVAEPNLPVLKKLRQKEIDWITITSSAIAESTVRLLGDHLDSVKLASIGPTTTAKLEALGYPPTAQAEVADVAGIVRAMIDHEQSDQHKI